MERVTIVYVGPAVELWDGRKIDGRMTPVPVEVTEDQARILIDRDPQFWKDAKFANPTSAVDPAATLEEV